MKKLSQITREDFENLLGWFSDDREKAGEKYEEIRRGLIRFFRFRGCNEPESLTDETFNRVAGKLSRINFDENVKMSAYFYSFASKIFLEYISQKKRTSFVEMEDRFADKNSFSPGDNNDHEFECLDNCLAEISTDERNLILQYYSKDKIAKIELRTKLAEKMNLKTGTLHTRVHRIRIILRNCLEKCLAKKES